MITGDEKWIVYNNVSRKRSWSRRDEAPERQAKADSNQKKVLLLIWWDWKGVIFYELLPKNKTINSDVYCEQLQKLSNSIAQERPVLLNRKGVCCPIHQIAQILRHQTTIYFVPYKTP